MDNPPQERPNTAHSLLFGLLALHNNFIDRDTLVDAINAWITDKSQPFGQILLNRDALTPARHAILKALVDEHLQNHNFDAERSLATVTVTHSLRDSLEEIPDLDLRDSLINLCLADETTHHADPDQTYDSDESFTTTDVDGRFRIVRFHDRGALGEVFIARDQQLHRMVALKRIKLKPSVDPDQRARFVVEAEITGRLEHPGIVPVYGLGTHEDGRPFYAMRFIRGDNLKTAIEQFHKSESANRSQGERNVALLKLLRRFLDVCNAIDYAHSRGVLHRDLKPGNIMLGKFGETLVVDWGLAKSVSRPDTPLSTATASIDDPTLVPHSGSNLHGTELGSRIGTPAYMSPEQAAGRIADLGPASDVYSLGATLYSLLTGRPPFTDTDLTVLLRKVENGEFFPPRKLATWIDPALDAICTKAMATNPANRYKTPRALADDVEHWLADEPVSAWREPLRRRLGRWARRHRLLVASLAATLVVAVGALTVGNVLVTRQRDIAERNLALARTVVDEMYTKVADKLANQEQMEDYEREILEKALNFYEQFALPQSTNPRVRLEAGNLNVRVAEIRYRLGQADQAQVAYRRAITDLEQLATDYPTEPAYRHTLAEAHFRLGTFLNANDLWKEASIEFENAVATWQTLSRGYPANAEYRQWQGESQRLLAFVHRRLGQLAKTKEEYRSGEQLMEQLTKEQPDAPTNQYVLGKLLMNSADFNLSQGDVKDIDQTLTRTLSMFESLVQNNPKVKKYLADLGECHRFRGNVYFAQSKLDKAKDAYQHGLETFQRLVADHPKCVHCRANLAGILAQIEYLALVQGDRQTALTRAGQALEIFRYLARPDLGRGSAKADLFQCLTNRAEIFTHLGRYSEALGDYEDALIVTRDLPGDDTPANLRLVALNRALTKARLGDNSALAQLGAEARATLTTCKLGLLADGYWLSHYDAACAYAVLAKLAQTQTDPTKSPEDRRKLSQTDLDLALDHLDKARTTGEFTSMIPLEEIRREPTLNPLRTNLKFQQLITELEKPKQAPAP